MHKHGNTEASREQAVGDTAVRWNAGRPEEPGVAMERVMGIEPTYEAWEAAVLPLNYTRSARDSTCISNRLRSGRPVQRKNALGVSPNWRLNIAAKALGLS